MADPKIERLKRVPIFSQCSSSELKVLAANTDEVTLPAGRRLISEGRLNHTFFILTKGEAEVTRAGKPVGTLGPGDFFGEISMLDRGDATATVTTKTPIDAMVMSHAQFRDAVRAQNDIAIKVIEAMAERLRRDGKSEL